MEWWAWALGWYGIWSVVAFVVFAADKARARGGGRRIRERTLHAVSAVGGWPGACAAMVLLRHKNRKVGFVLVTGAIVAAHVAAWAAVAARAA